VERRKGEGQTLSRRAVRSKPEADTLEFAPEIVQVIAVVAEIMLEQRRRRPAEGKSVARPLWGLPSNDRFLAGSFGRRCEIAFAAPAAPQAHTRASVAAIKRLDDQLARARRLFEYGEYDWDTFCARREEISEQKRQLERSAGDPEAVDLAWCESQLLDLTSAWETADSGQRSRLVAGIFEQLEAEALPEGALRVVAVPREAWRPFFERLVLERETGLAAPSTNHDVEFVYRLG
jgi:hypothetical protein